MLYLKVIERKREDGHDQDHIITLSCLFLFQEIISILIGSVILQFFLKAGRSQK